MTLRHAPDDFISLLQNNQGIKEFAGYAFPLKLTEENFEKVVSAMRNALL